MTCNHTIYETDEKCPICSHLAPDEPCAEAAAVAERGSSVGRALNASAKEIERLSVVNAKLLAAAEQALFDQTEVGHRGWPPSVEMLRAAIAHAKAAMGVKDG